jgi:Chaperone of endosialidase
MKQYKLIIPLAMIMELGGAPRIDLNPIVLPELEFSEITVTDKLQTTSLKVDDNAEVGCNLAIGCNLELLDSVDANHGNILKGVVGAEQLFIHNFGEGNTFTGINAGNTTLTSSGVDSAEWNVGFGTNALAPLTTGADNVAVGYNAGSTQTSGSGNLFIGQGAGQALLGTETGCILIGAGQDGFVGSAPTVGVSDVIKIGVEDVQTQCYIYGITGVNLAVAEDDNAVQLYIDTDTSELDILASSHRFKENIAPIAQVTADTFMQLRPVTFTRKGNKARQPQYGLVAEEVAKLMPELIAYRKGQVFTVKYHLLYGLFLKLIQDNRALIEQLKIKTESLEATQTQNSDLEQKTASLEKLVAQLIAHINLANDEKRARQEQRTVLSKRLDDLEKIVT